jgi:exonuclease SbcC
LPKSLSGGESFVISLALALGLSELANNGKAVDSLFLDEGFGSLDADVLNTVVNTLQSLRMQGKTVGVISHVEAVKKRIKTRIEMVKKPNGLSQLKKVS